MNDILIIIDIAGSVLNASTELHLVMHHFSYMSSP